MTYTIKIYNPPDFSTIAWILKYEPNSSVPFTTVQGTEHFWVWDFVSGSFLKDGETLVGYTIEIRGGD